MALAPKAQAGERFGQAGEARPVHVIQGEQKISDDPDAVLTTILGSCVAACLRDPVARIGGMNHFLLPGMSDGDARAEDAERYGVHAMELLVNALLERGAARSRLEAKLFGGAKTIEGLSDVGNLNAQFAEAFLHKERIVNVGGCLRGLQGRRIQFWPVSGRARRIFLSFNEEPPARRAPPPAADAGSLELF